MMSGTGCSARNSNGMKASPYIWQPTSTPSTSQLPGVYLEEGAGCYAEVTISRWPWLDHSGWFAATRPHDANACSAKPTGTDGMWLQEIRMSQGRLHLQKDGHVMYRSVRVYGAGNRWKKPKTLTAQHMTENNDEDDDDDDWGGISSLFNEVHVGHPLTKYFWVALLKVSSVRQPTSTCIRNYFLHTAIVSRGGSQSLGMNGYTGGIMWIILGCTGWLNRD